ncbi:MAG: hypothetical protein KAU60_14725 [Desulfobacterales bacterium]|nr:hypothetical protein [Desulfobacterales bacterium]
MAKSKQRKKREKKRRSNIAKRQADRKPSSIFPRLKTVAKFFIGCVTVLASIAGVLSLSSNICVEAKPPLKTGDLSSSPICISNNSLLPIHDVSYVCEVRELKNKEGGKIIIYEKGVTPTGFIIAKLGKGETATTGLPFTFVAAPIASVDFEFVVTYRPFWICPFTMEKPFRFASAVNDRGEIFLLPRSISEK